MIFPEIGNVDDPFQHFRGKPVTVRDCIQIVSRVTGVTYPQIKGHRRHKDICLARHLAYWAAYKFTPRSYPEIGRVLSGRDHTTIMHGAYKIREAAKKTGPTQKLCAVIEREMAKLKRQIDPTCETDWPIELECWPYE